jgi:hypothetical protein
MLMSSIVLKFLEPSDINPVFFSHFFSNIVKFIYIHSKVEIFITLSHLTIKPRLKGEKINNVAIF